MNPEEAPKTPPEETPPQSVESPPAHSPAPPDKPKSKYQRYRLTNAA